MGRPEVAVKYKNPATQVGGKRCVRRPDSGEFGGGLP